MRFLATTPIIWTACACALQAQTVIPNSNLELHRPGGFGGDFGFRVWQDAAKTDYTGLDFEYSGNSIELGNTNIDEGSDWYVVTPGSVFSRNSINAGSHPPIVTFNQFSLPPVAVGSGDFYLGVSTGIQAFPIIRPVRTVYGWVHLRPVNGVITMVSNAMSYDSPGIIVGTTTLVPEPSAIAIAVCGLGLLALCRRKRRY